MRTMGYGELNKMYYLRSLGDFLGINSEVTLGVFYQHKPLSLGGQYRERMIVIQLLRKKKRSLIQPEVDLYEFCASLFQNIHYYYCLYTNTYFP